MKLTFALVFFALALSLCNLMGKRGNTNSNSRSSGEIAESSPTPSPDEERSSQTTQAAPPTITQSAPRAGAPGSLPGVNHNSAASEPPPPPKKPTPIVPKIVSGGVLNGKAISKPQPAYPPIAKAAKASGPVTVQVTVDEKGNVISAHAVSGHPLLQQSAVSAARNWKFSPTTLSGQPVKVSGVIVFNFAAQ